MRALALASALALGASSLNAQSAAAGAAVVLQRYVFAEAETAGIADISLLAVPFALVLPLGSRLALQAAGAWAEGTVSSPDGDEATLSGLTDTEIEVALALVPDRVILTGGFVAPSGDATQALTEVVVAGVMAAELLPFAVSSWGSGGSAGGDLAFAFQAGRWGIGASGGYRRALAYEPLEDQTFRYRPGDELRARLALDRDVGESGTLSLVAGYRRFGEDAASGLNLFRSGNRYEGLVSYAVALGTSASALFYGAAHHREHGALLMETSDLEGATDSPAQDLLLSGANLRIPSGRVTWLPDAELRVFRSEDGVGQGWLGGMGVNADVRLGRRSGTGLVLSPGGRFRLGHVTVREGSQSGLSGWEASLTLRLEDGR